MRKFASFVLAGALLAALAGCTATSTSTTGAATIDGCKPTQPGASSAAIKVTGKYGAAPKVTIKAPIKKVKTTQRTVVSLGKGKVVKEGGEGRRRLRDLQRHDRQAAHHDEVRRPDGAVHDR